MGRPTLNRVQVPGAVQAQARSFSFPVTFQSHSGEEIKTIQANGGGTILELAHEHGVDIEGACGGECACSTCHLILDKDDYKTLREPDEDEMDMLDLALHVTDTSRLGCQITLPSDRSEPLV